MSRILVIDDEKDLVRVITDRLEACGHEVFKAYDGETGIQLAKCEPDLIILDIMMPGYDGYEVCDILRDAVSAPILFLSAKDGEMDKVRALRFGGDDYIVKPFSMKELLARIEAHLNREKRGQDKVDNTRLFFGPLAMDINRRIVTIYGKEVDFTRKEWDVCELLMRHAQQALSKDQIFMEVWGYDSDSQLSTVVEHIKNIRAKLAHADPSREYIQTVWGIGYRWKK